MTLEHQALLISRACKEAELGCHIKLIHDKKHAQTWAERIATRFMGQKELPVKNSYMYCDTLDMCFFYTPEGVPQVTYAGYATADSPDITEGKLLKAFRKADEVLRAMKRLAEEDVQKVAVDVELCPEMGKETNL